MTPTRAEKKLREHEANLDSDALPRLLALRARHPGAPIAFLSASPYYASGPAAATRLIEGVYATHPDRAREILRERIFLDYAPAFGERELIRVAAKRFRVLATSLGGEADPAPLLELFPPALPQPVEPPAGIHTATLALSWARAKTASLIATSPARFERDRAIACALLSREGKILGAEVNTNSQHRTHHAELKLVRRLLSSGQRIPPGATLVSTLQPCRMCAAAIVEAAESLADLHVIYADADPGPLGRNTALTRETPAWRAACAEFPELRLHEIQRQWDNSVEVNA